MIIFKAESSFHIETQVITISFTGKTSRVLQGLTWPEGFIMVNQEKGWMNTNLTLLWVRRIWLKHTKSEPSLLVWDRFQSHVASEVDSILEEGKTTPSLIPAGCTSVLQPLDVSLNRHLKVS